MTTRYPIGVEGLAALAVLSVLTGGGRLPRKSKTCRYTRFCGPPHPTTRQQRRQLVRQATAALRSLEPRP